MYQSSKGYNSDHMAVSSIQIHHSVCTAVISTKIHPQAIADNTKSVNIVQNEPSATIKMGVLLSLGQPAPISEPIFSPNTKEKSHSNGQQGISKRVEEDKTRETSNNTSIVKILRDVKWFSSKVKAPIHMKGAYSLHSTSILLYERNIQQ